MRRSILAATAALIIAVLVGFCAVPQARASVARPVPAVSTVASYSEASLAVWHPIPRWHAYLAALSQEGCWYQWGGAGPCWHGYDCSGLVVFAYAHVGIYLPHNTFQMLWSGRLTRISASQLKPGDLIFMYGGNHVELYTGWWSRTFGAHETGTRVGFSWWSNVYGFYHVNGSG